MLVEATRRLELRPGDVLYIGDMVVDIETARAAGLAVWVVATGSDSEATLTSARPDRMLQGLEELPAALDVLKHR